MLKYRSDRDSLGSIKIPSDAFYGPFTARATKQYHVTGQNAHPNLIKSFVMIKRSASVANMKVNVLGKKLGQYEYLHPNDHVNMSQSSNDTFPTAMHVAILFAIRDMLPVVDKLNSSLRKKAKQFSSYKKVGRTHLMDALPVTCLLYTSPSPRD